MKIIFGILLVVNISFASVWSLTMMTIATAEIIPIVTSNMGSLIAKQANINNTYKKVRDEIGNKRKNITNISTLDKLIILELKEINEVIKLKKEIKNVE